jgi:hypothetical protein
LTETNLPDNHPATATGAATLEQQRIHLLELKNNLKNNPGGAAPFTGDVPTQPITPVEPPRSTSRLVVLLSGMVAVVISICMFSYTLYSWEHLGITHTPDWNALTVILLSLGIGIVPYAVNKIFN